MEYEKIVQNVEEKMLNNKNETEVDPKSRTVFLMS